MTRMPDKETVQAVPETKTEYAVRFTGWAPVPGRLGEEQRVTKYDLTGTGENGLEVARRIAENTRLQQPHADLPADAVVVSRPVHEWTEVPDA